MHPLVENAMRWHFFLAQILFNFTPRFLSGLRSNAEQTHLFREHRGGNPVAFPGTSQHEFGFAYDLAPDVLPSDPGYSEKLDQLRDLGLALGMRWGGPRDPQHWQAFPLTVWQAIISGFSGGQSPVRRGVA